MDRKTMTKLIAALVMCSLVVVMMISGLFVIKPVSAVKNNQVSGMLFWGTSGVARMYGDMNGEWYTESSSNRTGQEEVAQHIWSSYTGNDYGFLNLGQFVNYRVSDAPNYATCDNDGGSLRVAANRGTIGVRSVKAALDEAGARGWYEKDPESDQKKKTAIVIWAGEDWIVRNADSNSIGLDTREALQTKWMGLDVEKGDDEFFAHQFDPGPGVEIKKDGGSLTGAHHGEAGAEVKDCDEPNVNVSDVLAGSSAWSGTHDYVFGNSYRVSDDNLNHFSYNEAEDGIEITLDHSLQALSDEFPKPDYSDDPEKITLGQQAGLCFGRVLSGYTYTVEYLEHNTETTTSVANEVQDKLVWVGKYYDSHDTWHDVTNTGRTQSNTTGVAPSPLSRDAATPTSVTVGSNPSHPGDKYTWWVSDGSSNTSYWTYRQSMSMSAGQHTVGCPAGVGYRQWTISGVAHNVYPGGSYTFTLAADATVYYRDYVPQTTYSWHEVSQILEHVPAHYDWEQKHFDINTRCDEDLAPTPGYADSHHMHLYGGVGGMKDVTGTTDVNDNDANVEHYINGSYGGVNGSPADHRNDYTKVDTWYTDPDKPIMDVVTENRNVKGYADYWSYYWSNVWQGELQVYVFGLGPYSKSIYDDQKDEIWTDGTELTIDTDGDGKPDRASTNNIGTASVSTAKSDWIVNRSIDTQASSGTIDEIKRTDRIEKSLTTFNSTLKSNLSGPKFVDIYDMVLEHKPYYRYQDVVTSGGLHRDDAQHGKWYDKNTYNWIFHVMWSTILKDNPNPEPEEPIDISFYAASCALTSYANTALSPIGRQGSGTDSVHTVLDVLAAGTSGAGAAVGYGDEDYDFTSHFITTLSETSSMTDYKSLIGVENGTDGSAMYTYARYGRLLQDLGLDQTGLTSSISPRTVPGFLMELCYGANSSLSIVWDVSIDILQLLNPFRFLVNQDTVDDVITDWNTTGGTNVGVISDGFDDSVTDVTITEETVTPDTIDGIDEYDSSAGQIESGLSRISKLTTMIYTRIRAMGLVLVIPLLLAFLVAGILLRNAFGARGGMAHWPRIRVFLIRVVFIVVGIPMLGLLYTSMLDSISGITSVAASPSSQLVSATFVDFEGWVKTSRLNPPENTVLESDGLSNSYAGHASQDSIVELRKTAWLINDMTGRLNGVDMSTFTPGLTSNSAWNEESLTRFDKDNWKDGLQSIQSVMGLLRDWAKGEFYYSSDFESETMALFSNTLGDHVGRHKGMYEDAEETGWDNANTLYQMFESVVATDDWLSRSVDDNTAILTGTGDYAEGTSTDTDWHLFNIYANGTLTATPDTNVTKMTNVTYGSDPQVLTDGILSGLSVRSHTGLSTLAMYNYLSTDFTPNALHIYSSARATNGHTSTAHYAVNLIGSGFTQLAFYLNCFALLFAVSIVGFFYSLRMTISVLKRGWTMLMTIPAAMVGVMKSIVQVIVTVISMILEILASILLYDVIAELLLSLSTVVEHYVDGQLTSVDATGVVGGLLGLIHRNLIGLQTNVVTYVFMLFVVSMIIFGFAFISLKHSYKFNCVFAKFVDFVFLQICENSDQRAAYLKPQTQHERREKPLLDADVFVSCVHELVVGG